MNRLPGVVGLLALACLLLAALPAGAADPFQLAPAVSVEAEHLTIEKGWKAIRVGQGNYAVDIIGFSHTSGEGFLHADGADAAAAAFVDVNVSVAGPWRLWVRYEYMPFTEARFEAIVEQGGKVVARKMMGGKESLRTCPWSDGAKLEPQYDPPWGNEGLTEEPLDVPALAAGPARIRLITLAQPAIAGVTANRNIDCLYLTSDVQDSWRKQAPYNQWYGILNAFRDSLPARYEVQFINRGEQPLSVATTYAYNRLPWGASDSAGSVQALAAGAASAWLPLTMQDTSHASMARFSASAAVPFTVAVRPAGASAAEETVPSAGEWVGIYLPPYPGKGEKAIHVNKVRSATLAALKAVPAVGKEPTLPLCYGGWVGYTEDSDYGRLNAQLFAALGMRNTAPWNGVDPAAHYKNLQAAGLQPTRSGGYGEYRSPPTPEFIAKAKEAMTKSNTLATMRRFDYGDEIAFGEWFMYMTQEKRKEQNNKDLTVEQVVFPLWQQWLAKHRPGFQAQDYWRGGWGALDPAQLRPDASAEAAVEKPRLYVDSVLFYEDTSIAFIAQGAKTVRDTFGPDVLTGCNYSCYPYYYPHLPMYVKWFRDGAADFGRHSEYFWQLGQVTPMINGYVAEHFRAGMRFNPKAILCQYTMPHSPGNTDGDFRRTAFTHLAHGAKYLDFFGIGMNETFTENYIDYRDTQRFLAVRDVTHSMALVEDVLEQSQVVASEVALLLSDSTERWDHASIAVDHFAKNQPPRNFREDRLSYHQDRVGIYTALTFAGSAPDVIVEEDVLSSKILGGYKVLFLVGDCLPVELAPALEAFAQAGGVIFATAGAGSFGAYHEANPAMAKLLGIDSRQIEERARFIRTSQELPFLKPLAAVAVSATQGATAGQFPALALHERIKEAAGAQVLARFQDDNSPAVVVRQLGKGRIYYAATLPGLAYLYTGLTTPKIWVADRGPGVHRSVTTYDQVAAGLLALPLEAAGVAPRVKTQPDYIDTRLVQGKGAFFLPLANYNQEVGQSVTITIRPPAGAGTPVQATSAFLGKAALTVEQGQWVITLPKLGYGDLLRIDVK